MLDEIIVRALTISSSIFIFVVIITPYIKNVAIHINAVDVPNSRKVHNKIMPRLGGLGVYLGFLLGFMLFAEPSELMNAILIGSFIIVIVGVIDDIKPLRSGTKFLGQFVAALIIAIHGDLLLSNINAFDVSINFGIFAYPITIFFILGCINAINLIDGLDGLSSGIASIYFLTIGIIGIITSVGFPLELVLAFVMLGATMGFLVHNFNPATIFIGDTGSMFLGFMISVIALLGFKNVTLTSLIVPLLILAIPILDTIFAILRRLLKGEKISTPDKFHIHHQFLNKNFSVKQTVIVIYLINILFAIASIIYILKGRQVGYFIYGVLFILVLIFILKTDVVFEHDKLKYKFKKIFKIKSSK